MGKAVKQGGDLEDGTVGGARPSLTLLPTSSPVGNLGALPPLSLLLLSEPAAFFILSNTSSWTTPLAILVP